MASDGSVAPKERVNIVYRPATGDAKSEVELPLKLLVIGDYTLREDETPIEEMKPINIDKDNFNDVLKAQKLSLDLAVPDKLDAKAAPDAKADWAAYMAEVRAIRMRKLELRSRFRELGLEVTN